MVDLVFWIVVGITIASAVMVVQSKQLLYSAIALLFTFVGVTGLYIFLWADFIAAVQVVVLYAATRGFLDELDLSLIVICPCVKFQSILKLSCLRNFCES